MSDQDVVLVEDFQNISVSSKYEIILNNMGYDGPISDSIFEKIITKFPADETIKVSRQYYPSCVEWHFIIFNIIVNTSVQIFAEHILIGIIEKAKEINNLLKNTPNKHGNPSRTESKFIFNDCSFYVNNFDIKEIKELIKEEVERVNKDKSSEL